MKILTYRELERKSALLPLMEQAFGWPFDPFDFERAIKLDPRLRDSSVGFCAVDEGEVLGYVGVMDLESRTFDGTVEKVGGIYGVATLPGHTRQGICRMLLNRAHQHFTEKGYRFSLLTTSPTIVAHALYKKLGYFDVTSFPGAYKVKEKIEKESKPLRQSAKIDFDMMLKIYRYYVKDKSGFVVRNKAYVRMLAKTNEITRRQCILTKKGYIIFKQEKKQIRIRELAARDEKEMNNLIRLVEQKAKNVIYARAVLDPNLRQTYRSRGFSVLESGHGVLMAKNLTNASFTNTYGNTFYMTSLDHF
jgi:ribosomal protein S18 acetylase RimI-like enzyme